MDRRDRGIGTRAAERGSALLPALTALMVLLGFGAVIMRSATASRREMRAADQGMRALYVAESGIHDAIASLTAGNANGIGTSNAPVALDVGDYWVELVDNLDSTFTVTSRAENGSARVALEAVVRTPLPDPFPGAVLAANDSGDPLYSLDFAGTLPNNDEVFGGVHSGGDLSLQNDAAITGAITAAGTISGGAGQTGVLRPPPDIAGMGYDTNNDVDVAAAFATANLQASASCGGNAWQLPQADPAHIFRMNPDDRAAQTAVTSKNDYFLEDPYELLGPDPLHDGTNASKITLSGNGNPGPDGNELVYYIDGNLWVMNLQTNSFMFENTAAPGFRVTFVVKGNIYVNDNLFYRDGTEDGVAFVAMKDPAEPDSGNVVFGDQLDGTVAPVAGSLKNVDGFFYAESEIQDNNLDHLGLGAVTYNGHLCANDQLRFKHDPIVPRAKLNVNHDPRLQSGALTLPGLPTLAPAPSDYQIVSWRRVSF